MAPAGPAHIKTGQTDGCRAALHLPESAGMDHPTCASRDHPGSSETSNVPVILRRTPYVRGCSMSDTLKKCNGGICGVRHLLCTLRTGLGF